MNYKVLFDRMENKLGFTAVTYYIIVLSLIFCDNKSCNLLSYFMLFISENLKDCGNKMN